MKRIVLGDTHGRYDVIEEIYNIENPDEVILLGDYCDSYVNDTSVVVESYKKIRKLQKEHQSGMFITLLGNHDWHYIDATERYSGYNANTWRILHQTLQSDFDAGQLPIVYIDNVNKTIYAHAGLTKTWLKEWDLENLEDITNVNTRGLRFNPGGVWDMHGNSKWQGPLWVRPGALSTDIYGDGEWTQVVGHTRSRNGAPMLVKTPGCEQINDINNATIIVIDTLPWTYLRETFDEDGKLVSREIVKHKEFNTKNYTLQ